MTKADEQHWVKEMVRRMERHATTESVDVGRLPPLQFPGVFQLPPAAFVQLFSGAGAAVEATK